MKSMTKTKREIVRSNVFTLFNFLNFAIAILLFAVKAYSNMAFIGIIFVNIFIGIAQELKAKKLVDELSILNRPRAVIRKNGQESEKEAEDIQEGDVMILESGKQICCDGQVLGGTVEVNESLLTGESDPVVKRSGDILYSGSFVVSGKCSAVVTHAKDASYAAKLAEEVRREKNVNSELLGSMKKVTHLTSFLILPLGVLLFLEAAVFRKSSFDSAVISSAAGLLGMLPKGLVLLISVSLAAGVIRLAKMKILVQNLYALETLAHVDVLCLDKTGTLTSGKMKVREAVWTEEKPFGHTEKEKYNGLSHEEAKRLLGAYLSASNDNNATIQALRRGFAPNPSEEAVRKIAFSSQRKWGSVSFRGRGTVFMGAPERILKNRDFPNRDPLAELEKEWMEEGCRVIAVGYTGQEWSDESKLPENIEPLYMIALEDAIRKNARETLDYFRKEGVEVKIISGDHVRTVSAVARRAGLKRWENAIDMSEAGENPDYDKLCERYTVFARVTPGQKKELVKALKRQGHRVAMTGDGVNDLLALREADCSIAVAEGSDASRQISQIVLLESDFSYLPQVVLEGRKVINNVTRTAGVFFIKTLYSVLVSVFCLILNQPFPFIPIQITMVDACMEAWPSFATIFEADTRRPAKSFLRAALQNAFPFALAVTGAVVTAFLTAPFPGRQNQTLMYLTLLGITMAAVIKSCVPFTKLRVFVCVFMVLGTAGALLLLPSLLELAALTPAMGAYLPFPVGIGAVLLLGTVWIQKEKEDVGGSLEHLFLG